MLEHAIGFLTHGVLIGVVAALSSFGTAIFCLRRDQLRFDHQDAELERTRALIRETRATIDEQNARLHRLWNDELQHSRLVDHLQNRVALLEREQYALRRQLYGVMDPAETTLPPMLEGEVSIPPMLEGDPSIPPTLQKSAVLQFSEYLRAKSEERLNADGTLRLGA